MTKLQLSGLFLGMITLSGCTYASDDPPFPDAVKTPVPPNPIPIPYPNIGKNGDKPDQKSKESRQRVDKNPGRKGVPRFRGIDQL